MLVRVDRGRPVLVWLAVLAGLALGGTVASSWADAGLEPVCPSGEVPSAGFDDVSDGNVHAAAIDCVAWHGVARGVSTTHYRPGQAVRRDQMASFMARMIEAGGVDLEAADTEPFEDIAGNVHAEPIRRLAAADVVLGTTADTYSPALPVPRDQMASLLVRAVEAARGGPLPRGQVSFGDIAGNTHAASIDKAAAAGLTQGTSAGTYSPDTLVRRDQMASFVARTLALLETEITGVQEDDERSDDQQEEDDGQGDDGQGDDGQGDDGQGDDGQDENGQDEDGQDDDGDGQGEDGESGSPGQGGDGSAPAAASERFRLTGLGPDFDSVDGDILGGELAIDRAEGEVRALSGVVFVADGNRPLRVTVDLENLDPGGAAEAVTGAIDVAEMDGPAETSLEVDDAHVRTLDDGLVAVEGEASEASSSARGDVELIASERLVAADAPLDSRLWTGTTATERPEVADPSGEATFDRILQAVAVGGDEQLTADAQIGPPETTTITVATTASTGLADTTRRLLVGADACATDEQPCPPADTFRWAGPLTVDIQPPRTEPLDEDLLLGTDPDRWIEAGASTFELPAELSVIAADDADADTIAALIADTDGGLVGQHRGLGFYRARYADPDAAEAARSTLDQDDGVAAVDNVVGRDHILTRSSSTAWQPVMEDQPDGYTWHWSQINMPQAWQRTTGSTQVRIGISDIGVNRHHPVLDALVQNYGLSGNGGVPAFEEDHGTHVSALACARDATGDENDPVVGAMQHCSMSILGMTFVHSEPDDEAGDDHSINLWEADLTARDLSNWVERRNLEIVNMSWSYGPHSQTGCAGDDTATTTERLALHESMMKHPDTLFVTSAGNCGNHGHHVNTSAPQEAASFLDNLVAVSATARDDDSSDGWAPRAIYSANDGTLAAPGGNSQSPIRSAIHCQRDDDNNCLHRSFDYGGKPGTSMASPIVAGIAGLMLDTNPELDGPQLAACLQEAATVSVTGPSDVKEIRAPLALDCAGTTGDDSEEVYAPETSTTTRVSVASNGVGGNAQSAAQSISKNGRYVAFWSNADNLVADDTNDAADVFVHDRGSGETSRISVTSDGAQANDRSAWKSSISSDGRYVAFSSEADNLVSHDTNEGFDVFVRDRGAGETERISVSSDGRETRSGAGSGNPSIDAQGRYVAFDSYSKELVGDDTNKYQDVFVHDRQTGATTRVSVASDGTEGKEPSKRPSISGDGRYVAFISDASLVPGDTNDRWDVYVRDLEAEETTRVSIADDGTQANRGSSGASISADGRYVAFGSRASNLAPDDSNGIQDVFVHDRKTTETARLTSGPEDAETLRNTPDPRTSISAGGRHVAFTSGADNLVSSDTNELPDVFLHDRKTQETSRVSVGSDGRESEYGGSWPLISADGNHIAFNSADDLVSGDANGFPDAFVRTP